MKLVVDVWVVAIGLPIVLMAGIVIPRKIVRGQGGWRRADFYLGLELCWTTLGACLLEYYSLAKDLTGSTVGLGFAQRIQANTTLAIVTLLVMMLVLALHQSWESSVQRIKQIVALGVVGNALGVSLFAAFVLFVQEVS
ncbi:hypothetical protein [Curtobacterium flaccumfaciens]|uniref:hypothetical protein n=1 Tax=Curtobacterium flaccumfaciens TaxID=2035 RepID=UPI000FFEE473|nr:hypothetical protein [Curtobacterium flaccumfaciens]MCS0647180.1 hypothetical protein [Curtobacterium flaccumfaciens pv. flaccumfaciens]MCS6524775.1 hypothetical protein [Curtobacterium flaccumfaciens pv. flaccumfaciens]MCS6529920.1 hypothetical protein [Curtobacterium flaccumfaciens pv. flaccumfaciens]NUU09864.1 hypothetical protein [Curtobacterium flaccumfaciens]